MLRRARKPHGRPVRTMGLTFPNPLGLAAGFDKTAEAFEELGAFGFGHVEVGTVTALAQPGNPKPRLVRLVDDRAVVNRMGFNNDGAAAVAQRLARRRRRRGGPVLGINIGKSKVVPDDDQAAVETDYETSTRLLAPYADYLVVNVSSPNTPGLRNLQAVEKLAPLLEHVRRIADRATDDAVQGAGPAAGQDRARPRRRRRARRRRPGPRPGPLRASSPPTPRSAATGLRSKPEQVEAAGAGGLSGAPLRERATEVVSLLRGRVGPDLTLIGVGGISTPDDARERLAAGADLIQAYTGLIYGGPMWPRRILKGIS